MKTVNNSDLNGMSLASFSQSRAEYFSCALSLIWSLGINEGMKIFLYGIVWLY